MSSISRYKAINNEDPHQLPERNPRDINVVERIKKSTNPTAPHVDDELVERGEIRINSVAPDTTVTKERLDEAVQTSLDKANTALQPKDVPGYDDVLTKSVASSTYATKSDISNLATKSSLTNLATKSEIANLVSKDEVYTKAEIDAMFAALSTNS